MRGQFGMRRVMIYFNLCFVSGSAVLDGFASLPVTMSNYPAPPPAYGSAATPQNSKYQSVNESREPLLASSSHGGAGGVYDQPDERDLPDDFKVRRSQLHSPTFLISSCSTASLSLKARLRFAVPSFAKFILFFVSNDHLRHQYHVSDGSLLS